MNTRRSRGKTLPPHEEPIKGEVIDEPPRRRRRGLFRMSILIESDDVDDFDDATEALAAMLDRVLR